MWGGSFRWYVAGWDDRIRGEEEVSPDRLGQDIGIDRFHQLRDGFCGEVDIRIQIGTHVSDQSPGRSKFYGLLPGEEHAKNAQRHNEQDEQKIPAGFFFFLLFFFHDLCPLTGSLT